MSISFFLSYFAFAAQVLINFTALGEKKILDQCSSTFLTAHLFGKINLATHLNVNEKTKIVQNLDNL